MLTVDGRPRGTVTGSGFVSILEMPPTVESGHRENLIKTFEIGANLFGFSASGIPVPADPH